MNQNLNYTLNLNDHFSGKMKNAIGLTGKMDSKITRFGSSIKGVGSTLAGLAAGAGIVSFGRSVIESLKNYEYFSASLRTLMKGDAKAAKALEGELVSLAAKTPFELTEVQDATKQLLAYGFSAGSVTKNIRMLGDVASGLKIPFGDIAYLYGTLKTQGRAYTKDIQQFTGRGIPIIKELAKQFKVADSQMMKLVEDGKVGFKDVEKAFQSMTSEGGMFFNMMNEQSKTVGGQLSNMADQWEQLKVNIGKSTSGIIKSVTDMLNSLLGGLNKGLVAWDKMDESFAKRAELRFSFWEKYIVGTLSKIGMLFGMKPVEGGFAEMQKYTSEMSKSFVESAETITSLKENQQKLLNIMGNIRNDESMDSTERLRRMSVLQTLINDASGKIGLLEKGGEVDKTASVSELGKTGGLKTGTEVSGSRPQNLYININKLVETMNIKSSTIKEGAMQVKQMVAETLLEAVNDVNYISK